MGSEGRPSTVAGTALPTDKEGEVKGFVQVSVRVAQS